MTRRDGYDAFIYYSHAHDGQLVPALHSGLERFAKRWYQLRALRIFYDSESLSASPELWGAVESALERSTWFILSRRCTQAGHAGWHEKSGGGWNITAPTVYSSL